MTVPEVIARYAAVMGETQTTAGRQLRGAIETIAQALADTEHLDLPGLGVFRRTSRKARTIRNPITHELMRLGPDSSIAFRPCKALKAKVQ